MMYSDKFSICLMCNVLNVSRASFYHYFYYSDNNNNNNNKAKSLIRIAQIYYDSNKTYGAPRIRTILCREGLNISIKTVSKYMNLLGLKSIVYLNYPKSNNKLSDDEKALIINKIKGLNIIRPNQVWTTDITYIKTSEEGSQYRSHAFRELVVQNNCLYSYTSFHHSCDENANQESFHASLRMEWLYRTSFNTLNDVKRAVFDIH